MATSIRPIRAQWLARQTKSFLKPTPRRFQSTQDIQSTLLKREISPTFTDLSPVNSYRLDVTLANYLPSTQPPPALPPTRPARDLPPAHDLCYFEPTKRASEMMPDGTNPDHAPPGGQSLRRMWAGGRVFYNNDNPLVLDGGRAVCAEFIRNVDVKGEKVFVSVERRMAKASEDEIERLAVISRGEDPDGGAQAKQDLEHRIRQRLWRDRETDFGEGSLVEIRTLVFLKGQKNDSPAGSKAGGKILTPQHKPDYTHTFTPDPKLLFRYSALTFNAHAIHLDPEYTKQVEGHRNLLFHGPLSYTFLVTLLQQRLQQEGNEVIKSVEYRNLAPLYCHEPVKFCGTQTGERKWEIWAETPEGGIAVKGTAVSEAGRIDKANLGV